MALQDDNGNLTVFAKASLLAVLLIVLAGIGFEVLRSRSGSSEEAEEVEDTDAYDLSLASRPTDDRLDVLLDVSTNIAVLNNDTVRDGGELASVTPEEGSLGSFELADDEVRFTPDPDQLGESSAIYVIADEAGEHPALLVVNVISGADAPTVAPLAAFGGLNETLELDPLATAVSPVGESISVSAVREATNATAEVDGDRLRFTLTDGDDASALYEISDESGRAALGSVTVRRRPEPDEALWFAGVAPVDPEFPNRHRPLPPVEGSFLTPLQEPLAVDIGPDGRVHMAGGATWTSTSQRDNEQMRVAGSFEPTDGDWIAVADPAGVEIAFNDIESWGFDPVSIAVADDGRIAVGGRSGEVFIIAAGGTEITDVVRGEVLTDTTVVAESNPGSGNAVFGLDWASDGSLWFSHSGEGTINRWADGQESVVAGGADGGALGPVGTVNLGRVRDIEFSPTGELWFNHPHGVSRISGGEVVAVVARPEAAARTGAVSLDVGVTAGLAFAADGSVWFSDQTAGSVHRIDPTESSVATIDVTPAGGGSATMPIGGPTSMAQIRSGEMLIADRLNHRVLMVSTDNR